MADPRYADVEFGPKKDAADTGVDVDDPGYQLNVYRGNGPSRPKKPKDQQARRSPKAEAMRRRIDLAKNEE